MTKKMPFGVDPDKFKKSELFIPDGMSEEYLKEQLARQKLNPTDALRGKDKEDRDKAVRYGADSW